MVNRRTLLIDLAYGMAVAMLCLLYLTVNAATTQTSSAAASNLMPRGSLDEATDALPGIWLLECADCPHQFSESTDRMLRLDSLGRPHLAYGRDHLYYAWYDGSVWHSEIADGSHLVGTYASLALDAAGEPHISYYDEVHSKLKYAYRDASGWHVETLGDAAAGSTSLALHASGYAHISFYYNSRLHYAYQTTSGWMFEAADSASLTGRRSSLALDAGGVPHISYWDEAKNDLKYARRDGNTWNQQVVDTQHLAGQYSSIALDAAGRPRISYSYFYPGIPANRDLRFAAWDGSSWITATVDAAGGAGEYNSLFLDSGGSPHISYYADNTLRYANLEASTWLTETVDSSGNTGAYSSIAIDAQGWAHIGYYESVLFNYGQNIRYSKKGVSGWQESKQVDTGGSSGAHTSLGLDSNGYAHISYQDVTYKDLRYAIQTDSGWDVRLLDWAGEVGTCTSLALDAGGYPHIGYHDVTNQKLKYTYQNQLGWHTMVVDAPVAAACEAALALDSDGYPHFTYFDTKSSDLKYAYRDASGWSIMRVEQAGDGIASSSIVLDGSGTPHISYLYAPAKDLRYAYQDGGKWVTATVDSTGSVGWESSLALDASGRPGIAYRDDSGRDLKYAHFDGTTWDVSVVDSFGDTGRSPSLAFGQDGVARISYTGDLCPLGSCGRLKYAELGGSGWVTQTIASPGGYYGFDSSLSLSASDQPRISFYDPSSGDLKYATTPVSLASALIAGPANGTVASVYTFTASLTPPDATRPITHTWQADDQPPVVRSGGWQDSISYTWNSPGSKQVTLTAANRYSQVSTSHTITISDIPISGLSAASDSPTRPGEATTLSASVQAGTNVSYSWDFGDGHSGSGATVTHTYPAAGSYTAQVTASNSAGSATAFVQVLVGWSVHLPLVPDS